MVGQNNNTKTLVRGFDAYLATTEGVLLVILVTALEEI